MILEKMLHENGFEFVNNNQNIKYHIPKLNVTEKTIINISLSSLIIFCRF